MEELQTLEIKNGHAREVVHKISRLIVQSSRLMTHVSRLMPCSIVDWIATDSSGPQLVDLYLLLVDICQSRLIDILAVFFSGSNSNSS